VYKFKFVKLSLKTLFSPLLIDCTEVVITLHIITLQYTNKDFIFFILQPIRFDLLEFTTNEKKAYHTWGTANMERILLGHPVCMIYFDQMLKKKIFHSGNQLKVFTQKNMFGYHFKCDQSRYHICTSMNITTVYF